MHEYLDSMKTALRLCKAATDRFPVEWRSIGCAEQPRRSG
jgi:hypothetical protein